MMNGEGPADIDALASDAFEPDLPAGPDDIDIDVAGDPEEQ